MTFAKGSVAIWKPIKSRTKCYGHSIATDPVPVEIVSGPDRSGKYKVKVVCKKAMLWLTKDQYDVRREALRGTT